LTSESPGISEKQLIDLLKSLSSAGDLKAVIIDSDGNIVGDIPLSTLARTRVYEQSFEGGTSDLTANNATQTVQSTEVYSGSYALQVTISAGQTGYVETPPRHVSASQQVTFVFAHKEDANITDIKLIVIWYRTNMHELAAEEFTLDVTDTWQLDSRTVTAPKRAAYMAIRIQATAGSSDGNVYVDDITIDLVGQIFRVDGAGQIKVADTDLLEALIDNVKGAWRLGVKDLTLSSNDPEITIPSGMEVDFADMTLENKYFNYGVTRCHGNLRLKAGSKLRLGAGSVFRFVR